MIETHPVQTNYRERAVMPVSVTAMAYEVYAHCYGEQEALKNGGRGGFGVDEIVAFLYARNFPRKEWYDRVKEAFNGMKL